MRSEMNSWRNIDSDYPLPLYDCPKKKKIYKICHAPNVAHVGKVNSNRVFCFFSPLFLFCIKCPPCRAVLPAWLKKRVAMAPVQTTATATALAMAKAMLHFVASLFTFLMRLSWLKPMGQRTLAGFVLAGLPSLPSRLPACPPDCLTKSSAEQAGPGQASPVVGQATTCNANGVYIEQ